MTRRKPPKVSFRWWVDRQIDEARERGEFDDLPGTGKPLPKPTGNDAATDWVLREVRKGGHDTKALLPPALALKREVQDLPDTLAECTTLQSVVSVKGMRNRVTWTIVELDAPHHVVLKGTGKGGTKFSMRLAVAASGDGSTLSMKIDLGGAPLFGPIGSGVARALHGDLQSSLDTFARRYGGN